MRLLSILIAHLLVTLARLTGPGGVRAVAAESLAVCVEFQLTRRLGSEIIHYNAVCGELLISPESAIRHAQPDRAARGIVEQSKTSQAEVRHLIACSPSTVNRLTLWGG